MQARKYKVDTKNALIQVRIATSNLCKIFSFVKLQNDPDGHKWTEWLKNKRYVDQGA